MTYLGKNNKSPMALFTKVSLIHFEDITTSWKNKTNKIIKYKKKEGYQLSTQEIEPHSEKCLFLLKRVKPILSKLYLFESIKKFKYIIKVTKAPMFTNIIKIPRKKAENPSKYTSSSFSLFSFLSFFSFFVFNFLLILYFIYIFF